MEGSVWEARNGARSNKGVDKGNGRERVGVKKVREEWAGILEVGIKWVWLKN